MPPTGCCSIAVRTRDAQLCKAAARSSGWRRPENASKGSSVRRRRSMLPARATGRVPARGAERQSAISADGCRGPKVLWSRWPSEAAGAPIRVRGWPKTTALRAEAGRACARALNLVSRIRLLALATVGVAEGNRGRGTKEAIRGHPFAGAVGRPLICRSVTRPASSDVGPDQAAVAQVAPFGLELLTLASKLCPLAFGRYPQLLSSPSARGGASKAHAEQEERDGKDEAAGRADHEDLPAGRVNGLAEDAEYSVLFGAGEYANGHGRDRHQQQDRDDNHDDLLRTRRPLDEPVE